jgi:type 1 glutamine amidotransferase
MIREPLALLARRPAQIAGWALAACVLFASVARSVAADAQPIRICLLSASAEYGSEKSLSEFQTFLETNYQIVCQRAFGKDSGKDLPGLESLENADLIIVFTRRVTLPPDHLALLKKYFASGRPVMGIRTASHAFKDYMEFDHEVLGGGYKGHYTNSVSHVFVAPGRSAHPILAGVTPFASRKLYKNPTLADDDEVLLEASIPDHLEPVAWARDHDGRRVFYTSLGVQEDFKLESFRRLLVNAIFWTTRHDEAASRRTSSAAN